MSIKSSLVQLAILIAAFCQSPAQAQEDVEAIQKLIPKEPLKVDKKLPEGWTPKLKLSGNVSFTENVNTLNAQAGKSNTLGGQVNSALYYRAGSNEWRNNMDYSGKTTKTPAIPRYVKSEDALKLATIYLRGFESVPWLGPYARAEAETAIFKNEDIQAEDVTYVDDANVNNVIAQGKFLPLTSGFRPLTTKEAMGFFAKIIERKMTLLETRLGLGATQVKARGQRVVVGKTDDGKLRVRQLEDFEQAGLEYGFVFKGKWDEKSDYLVSADFLTPLGTDIDDGDPCDNCSDVELTNVDFKARVSTKLYDWATLSYEYRALRQPALQERWQIISGLVLNFSYDVF